MSNLYAFQGQESDDEIKGEGNSVNYKYRMHDPRLGRFFAVDPLARDYPHNSPYAFSENIVINAVELEGLEKIFVYNEYTNDKGVLIVEYSHFVIDKTLKENINRRDHYNAYGDPTSSTYKKLDGSGAVNIRTNTAHKNPLSTWFKSTEPYDALGTKVNNEKQLHGTGDKGSWEGSDDGGSTGGSLGGEHGWNNGGKQLFFGTIGLVTAPLTFGAATTWLGYTSATVGTLNNIDDVGGAFLPKTGDYQSLTQSLVSSQGAKDNISKTKGILNYANFIGGGANTLGGLTKPMTLNGVSGGVNTLNEGLQLKSSTEELKK